MGIWICVINLEIFMQQVMHSSCTFIDKTKMVGWTLQILLGQAIFGGVNNVLATKTRIDNYIQGIQNP